MEDLYGRGRHLGRVQKFEKEIKEKEV